MIPVDIFLARWFSRKVSSFDFKTFKKDHLTTKIPKMLGGLKFGTGKGNSGKNQDMVTLVSCEYAHWTLMAQVRPAPGNGGSTSHKCYPVLELSGYLSWTISSIRMGSWRSWRKTLVNWIWNLAGFIIRWTFSCDFTFISVIQVLPDSGHTGEGSWVNVNLLDNPSWPSNPGGMKLSTPRYSNFRHNWLWYSIWFFTQGLVLNLYFDSKTGYLEI